MSDDSGFDKEAERERLREKYERDREKREQSERMSELLLQGATMTNRHCGECGNPIFRYEGQEFCPTCQKPVGSAEQPQGEQEQRAQGQAEQQQQREPAQESEMESIEIEGGDDDLDAAANADAGEADVESGTESVESGTEGTEPETPTQADRRPRGGQEPPEEQPRTANGRAGESSSVRSRQPTRPTDRRTGGQGADSQGTSGRSAAGADGGLADAEASLARTVEKFARGAEESGDLGRAREYLAAAREAAEALEAVRRAE